MRIMVTGSSGQLGSDVTALLKERGHEVIAADLPQFDITKPELVENFIKENSPDAVIHLAAYTAVDKAEEEIELCFAVNALGTENVAKVCGENNIKLLYTCTDYVFGGDGDKFYEITDTKCPCNVYGETKLYGEEAIKKYCEKYFIVRISWVFGPNGKNFVYTMLNLAEKRDEINVVCDQVGSPTYTPDLSRLIGDMIVTEKYGTYHASNEGICSWAQFAEEIMQMSGKKTKINPIPTSEYPVAAKRPLNSRLSKASLDAADFERLPHWKDALERFLALCRETENNQK